MPTPRVFLIRHGQTEWSQSGQYTGLTDIPLTPKGESQVRATATLVVGPGKLVDPKRLFKVLVSPRQRALRTAEILLGDWREGKVEICEGIREWEYGIYEGKLTAEIREGRRERGLDGQREWDIWRDGCEEGEAPGSVRERVDAVIERIRGWQGPRMDGDGEGDVVVIAHGHVLRAFAKRWLGYGLGERLLLMLEPGGVGVLTYDHKSLDEPAMLVGLGFPVEK